MNDRQDFAAFEKSIIPDQGVSNRELTPKYKISGFTEFFQLYSGLTFANGAYHVLDYDRIEEIKAGVEEAFPNFSKRTIPFAHDWLGRVFALDGARREGDEPLVLWFDYADNSALNIPRTFNSFHNIELPKVSDVLLSTELYEEYLASGGVPPAKGQCCGFEIPIFLGGSESVDNLKLIDVDVYWSLTSQLIAQTAP